MDPTPPSQPTQQTGLNQAANPVSKTTEESSSSHHLSTYEPPIDHRSAHDVPSTHTADATPTSMGYGDRGALKQKDVSESDKQGYSYDASGASNENIEGEQMRAPGEGDVAAAVQGVKQGGGEEESLTAEIDIKAERHARELHKRGKRTGKEIEEEEKEDWTGKRSGVDLEDALGGRGVGVVEAVENS